MYTLPPELIDLSGPLMFVAIAFLAVRRTFDPAHGPHPEFAGRFRQRWEIYSEQTRKLIAAGAAILLFGVMALAVEVGLADGAGPDDFIAILALSVGAAQVLYGITRARRADPKA